MTVSDRPIPPLMIRLFGGFEVLVHGAPLPKMRSRKERLLLALLVLAQGRDVNRIELIQKLWPFPDYAEGQAAGYLRTVVMNLRKALGAEGYRLPKQISRTLHLELTGADVDVVAFDRAIARNTPAALEEAIALYQGPLLMGHTDPWIEEAREERLQSYQQVVLAYSAHAQETDDFDAAIRCLRLAVARDRQWQRGVRALMDALARSGDHNAAIQVYNELCELLSGILQEPDKETTDLYKHIRDEISGGKKAPEPKPEVPLGNRAGFVPYPVTGLVDRVEEVQAVKLDLRLSRLITLSGPGGVGKTRLALQVAEELEAYYADGIWFIDLAPLEEDELVPQAVADVLEARGKPGYTITRTLQEHLKHRQALLILDNCEHLHAASARLAADLLAGCADVRILATSRQPLGLMGEVVWRVPSLSVPDPSRLPTEKTDLLAFVGEHDAVKLFLKRAQAAERTFQLTAENASAVARICHVLDGIPLALELAAARVRMLAAEQIAQRMNDMFSLLTLDGPTIVPRQKTLCALITWSYDLLSPQEQTLLERLAVFRGGWTLEAVEAICADARVPKGKVFDLLASLVEQSLILAERQPTGKVRYRLLETVRLYCLERLQDTGDSARMAERHRDWFVALAEQAEKNLRGPEQAHWLDRLEEENDNLRAVLGWLCETRQGEAALRLAGALWRFWYARDYAEEGGHWLERALHAGPDAPVSLRLRALNVAGNLAYIRTDYTRACACYEACLALLQEAKDELGVARMLCSLGNVARDQADYARAREYLETGLAIFRQRGDQQNVILTLANLALLALEEQDYAKTCSLYQESLAIFRETGDLQNVALALNNLAIAHLHMGDLAKVRSLLAESLELSRQLDYERILAHCLSNYIRLAVREGSLERAAVLVGANNALRARIAVPISPNDAAEYARDCESVRAVLGEAACAKACAQGRALSTDQLTAYLLEYL